MRVLVIGAGGVGAAVAAIARRRPFFEAMVLADVDPARADAAAARAGDPRITGTALDASDPAAIVALARAEKADAILNACDPWLNPPIFAAAREAGVTYLDMAMTLSERHPERPFELPGRMLGDEQFAAAADWEAAGRLALVGMGVEPGLSDVFARYAQDHLFSEIDECGVRDGANLTVEGYDFAPSFSIWTTIEECLNPPVIWERGRDWFTTEPVSVRGVAVAPRDVVAAVLPDPATLGPRMTGATCAGTWVSGTKDGADRQVYLYHVVDNAWSMAEYGSQAVVWQTAVNPVVALELLASGTWSGAGVLGPEAFDAVPFLELLTEYGSPWRMREGGQAGR